MTITRADVERVARIARVLIDAALANHYVQDYIQNPHPSFPRVWTVESVRKNPPVRVEFEHAICLGGVGEALAACRSKPGFGELIGVLPVEPDDPVGELRLMYLYKESSPYNRRIEQRKWLKKRLGRRWRKLVGQAMSSTKRDWLEHDANEDVTCILRQKFNADPGRFWRIVKGREWIERGPNLTQPEFDFEEPTWRPSTKQPVSAQRPASGSNTPTGASCTATSSVNASA